MSISYTPTCFNLTHWNCFWSVRTPGSPAREESQLCHLPTTLTAMRSHILFSKDRWGPAALGRAGALRAEGHGRQARWRLCPHRAPQGRTCSFSSRRCSGYSQRMPCRASGWGGCDHSGTQTPDIPFWGCRREAKRNVKRCLKARRKPVGLSRSSICGKKPWHGAAGSTAKIDRGAEKRLNSGSNVPPQRKSRSREWGRPRPSLQLPSGPQHQTERGRES